MESEKAPGYWPTRVMLAIAILVVGCELLPAPAVLWRRSMEPMFDPNVWVGGAPLGVPLGVWLYLAGVGLGLAGLVRMIRVFRGPRNEPPPWRYRDR